MKSKQGSFLRAQLLGVIELSTVFKCVVIAGAIAQLLRARTADPKVLGSNHSNCLVSYSRGNYPLLVSSGRRKWDRVSLEGQPGKEITFDI